MTTSGPARPVRVLIVEADAVTALHLAEEIRTLGHEVCGTADNSSDAWNLAATHRPDLVVANLRLGRDLDGLDLATRIHQTFGSSLILLTTQLRGDCEVPAGGVKAIFVVKPFACCDLHSAISKALYLWEPGNNATPTKRASVEG